MNETKEYYQNNAQAFFDDTVNADISEQYDRFLKYIPNGGKILDFGCGSGRDAKAFLQKGYCVNAIDGSSELCRLASDYCGIPVKCMDFYDLPDTEKYDGIWACASLLHIPKNEMPIILSKMEKALTHNGIIYASFKLGDFEGNRNGRFFSDVNPVIFEEMISDVIGLVKVDEWFTEDVRPEKKTTWYNVILRKNYLCESDLSKI